LFGDVVVVDSGDVLEKENGERRLESRFAGEYISIETPTSASTQSTPEPYYTPEETPLFKTLYKTRLTKTRTKQLLRAGVWSSLSLCLCHCLGMLWWLTLETCLRKRTGRGDLSHITHPKKHPSSRPSTKLVSQKLAQSNFSAQESDLQPPDPPISPSKSQSLASTNP
jgi:hypothetical protein